MTIVKLGFAGTAQRRSLACLNHQSAGRCAVEHALRYPSAYSKLEHTQAALAPYGSSVQREIVSGVDWADLSGTAQSGMF